MSKKKGNVTFIRRRGKIIPIKRSGKNARAASDILSSKNAGSIATIGAASLSSFAGLYSAGKLQKVSQKLEMSKRFKAAGKLNRLAKLTKFASKSLPALAIGTALVSIDRKSRDEGSSFDIGKKTGAFNVASSLALGYLSIRTGKRFEKWGLRGGKFPIKLKDI